ncbi:MAG TPA: AAA family ATPase, partial [Ktedonobacterales bacterium]|nr:AAA family ATPase [Ktedonobacterales bacterium]
MPAQSFLSFGEVLKRLRMEVPLTQRELSDKASLSERGISDLERGVNRKPQQQTFHALASALGLAADRRHLFERAAFQGGISVDELSALLTSLLPLIGRATESALIARLLSGQGPPLLLFTGEPGIGKSHLLREAAKRGRASGWRVLEGACAPLHVRDPYSPITEALATYVADQELSFADLSRPEHNWLVRLLSGRDVYAMPRHDDPMRRVAEDERRVLFASATRFLGDAAAAAGTLLLLDDLQWAGADALDFLVALIRSPARRPIRIVGAYRSTEVGAEDPLSRLLAYLISQQLAQRRELGALADDEADALLSSLLGKSTEETDAQKRRILQRSGGVPFYLVSWAHGLRASASDGSPSSGRKAAKACENPASEEIPRDVVESIRWRLGLLSPTTRELLGVVATASRAIPFPVLLSASTHLGHGEQDQICALEAVQHARLLTEQGEEGYRFTHDLIREVVWEDLSMARRTFLHRRLAEVLEQSEAHGHRHNAAELAWHFLQAHERASALPFALQAGDQAKVVYAHTEAEYHYRTALELALELGDRPREAEAREKLGGISFTLARYDEALALYEHVAAAYRTAGDLEGEVRVAAQLGWVHTLRGTPDEGQALIQRLLDLSP